MLAAVNRMFRILGQNHGDILKKMLSDMELAQAKVSGPGQKIYELDCEISCLTRKLHKIASMQTVGILDPADFTAQTNTVNQKLSALRRQRCQLLQQSDDAGDLARLREVCETIMDTEPTDGNNIHSPDKLTDGSICDLPWTVAFDDCAASDTAPSENLLRI